MKGFEPGLREPLVLLLICYANALPSVAWRPSGTAVSLVASLAPIRCACVGPGKVSLAHRACGACVVGLCGTLWRNEPGFAIFVSIRLGGNKKAVTLRTGKQNVLNQSFPIIELCPLQHIVYGNVPLFLSWLLYNRPTWKTVNKKSSKSIRLLYRL